MESEKVVPMIPLHLSQKPPTLRQIRVSHVSVKPNGSIFYIALVSKQMLKEFSRDSFKTFKLIVKLNLKLIHSASFPNKKYSKS